MSARRVALGLAGGFAVLMPLALLVLRGNPPDKAAAVAPPPAPLAAPAMSPPLAAAYERPLFGAANDAEDATLPGDAPALVGIVGRLGADAVALVRTADGATRALRIGESVDGWQLASLAIDAAFFTRGAQRVRVPLPVS
ncbi:hypothetical protein [Sphingomonas psychrotolerans]|uniref:Type II secretion system protein GspC N-terminal domain-containing protein n=1 Tax=Sphingomonas psychrotolerans TaxID=1327635 RepID=A0A2K8MDQ9_9SPHN|nr:hypothetical protein [Sphingomonas psychrotolerans]ATY32030.1 hypothetical protein CVN68_08610 [Sphingomonas psychrotolerans]